MQLSRCGSFLALATYIYIYAPKQELSCAAAARGKCFTFTRFNENFFTRFEN